MNTSSDASSAGSPSRFRITRVQRCQLLLLTLGAVALFAGARLLPIGTNLSHGDFRVTGRNAIEMCDPARPAFIPVVDARSPVVLRLDAGSAPATGRATRFTLSMATLSGKPVGPRDLAVSHTELLHLLVIDPSLGDYQHLHPAPGRVYGTWEFEMTPRRAGLYRVFADFTPVATGLGLYAHADFEVPGAPAPAIEPERSTEADGFRYEFSLRGGELRAGRTAELDLTVRAGEAGREVPLEPVMGAYAHVVAFDPGRLGFAHLHPMAVDPLAPPDAVAPRLAFQVAIPSPGRYVVWGQVKIGGVDRFAPFGLDVLP